MKPKAANLPEKPGSSASRDQTEARTVGRGMVWLTAAKLYFIGSATLLTYLLTILFDKRTFGRYGVVVGVLNVANMMIVQGTLQAVSKFVSESPERGRAVRKAAFRLQSWFAVLILLFGVLAAPVWASLLGDPTLALPLRVGFVVTIAYAFYAALIGELNGRKLFHLQASMDMSFATLKLGTIIAAAALGLGVVGAMAGFATTAVIMTVVAALVLIKTTGASAPTQPSVTPTISAMTLLKFEAFIIASAGVLNLLLNQDLLLLKGLLSRSIGTAHADAAAGGYNTALLVARLTYQATISITFVIFPLLSRSTFEQDKERTSLYIRNTMKYSLLLVSIIAGGIAAVAPEVYRILLPKYTEAAGVASVLAVAYAMFCLMLILSTMLTASGNPQESLLVMVVALVVSVGTNAALIPKLQTWGAATGTTIGMSTGFLVAAWLVWRRFHTLLPLADVLRIILPIGLVVAGLFTWQPAKLGGIAVKLLVAAVAIPAVSILSGAFSRNELAQVRAALSKQDQP